MTKVEKKFAAKEQHILHLSESMVNGLIEKTEASVQGWKDKQAQIFDDFKKAEETYLMYKAEYEKFQAEIDKEMQTIEVLVRYKKNEAPSKRITVLRSISNTNQKLKERTPYLRWSTKAEEILEKENRFMSLDYLVQRIIDNNPEYRAALMNTYKNINAGKHNVKNQLKGRVQTGNTFCFYNEKFGLKKWVGEDGRPIGNYIKAFMAA